MTARTPAHHERSASEERVLPFLTAESPVEGRLKVTGQASYTADLSMPDMLWAKFLTSPLPYARLVSIDVSVAKQVPGVHAVLTGEDVRGAYLGRRLLDCPVLAWECVRFIGDRVAAVAAETPEAAEEALRLIEVEYEELPAVFEPQDALREEAPILHPDASTYAFLGGKRLPVPHPNVQGHVLVQKGDGALEEAFDSAERVFEHTFTTPRHHHGYIEPHATLVWIDEEEVVHIAASNKAPFLLRDQVATTIGLPSSRIVVENAFVGGDFGGKGTPFDEAACYSLARATGRPVKFVMTYIDELRATNPRPAAIMHLRTGVDSTGRFVAHTADILFNGGAYAAGFPLPTLIPDIIQPLGGLCTLEVYSVLQTRIDFKTVYTNTVPAGHMRAPGEVQVQFASESHVDMIARELGMDPLEFRLLNSVKTGEAGPSNGRFHEARGTELLEALRRETHWGQMPLAPGRGRGISLNARQMHGGVASVVVRLLQDGMIEVLTAQPDQGGGSLTALRRIAATALSVDPEHVRVSRTDTSHTPFDLGSAASRVTWINGQATHDAATRLKAHLEMRAAEVMGWPTGHVRLEGNRFVVRGAMAVERPFSEVAVRLAQEGSMEMTSSFTSALHGPDALFDYNFSAYMIEVDVDAETGQTRLLDAVLVVDVGTIINPIAHQGQLDGGFVMGLGAALMEEVVVEDGKVTTLSLGDYKLPSQVDVPPLRTILLPTTVAPGPFGAKMAGELNNSGVAPAVANAIADAVGVRVTMLPLSAERVLQALSEKELKEETLKNDKKGRRNENR